MSRKRRVILEAAERQFLLRGYEGTSIDTIVEEVGGSKSTVYAHFNDKARLFAAVLRDVNDELDFSLPRARSAAVAGPRERILLAVTELLSLLYRERTVHLVRLLIAEGRRFPEVASQFWNDGIPQAQAVLAELIQETSDSSDAAGRAETLMDAILGRDYLETLSGAVELPDDRAIAERAGGILRLL